MKARRKTAATPANHRPSAEAQAPPSQLDPPPAASLGLTGRYLVTFRDHAMDEGLRSLARCLGVGRITRAADSGLNAPMQRALAQAGAVWFDRLGVAVLSAPPDAGLFAAAQESPAVWSVEPERIMRAATAATEPLPADLMPAAGRSLDYLRGYRDAVNALVGQVDTRDPARAAGACDRFTDSELATWGLQATRAVDSRATGRSVRIAVLDTGLDIRHPDLAGRAIQTASFVPGQSVADKNGHGTHCIGTACGPRRPVKGRRYGVAGGSRIFAGKVLDNAGSGTDAWILAGIDWAVANRCQVVSISLGAAAPPSQAYETAARRAMAAGTLIVAAAGNDGDHAISRPANSPSILAVGALDADLRAANFSNRGARFGGGQVDMAAPGVDVYSAWPGPTRYRVSSGTSMAAPHVAGIAALWVQARRVSGAALWQALSASALRLGQPSIAVGAGLAQAP